MLDVKVDSYNKDIYNNDAFYIIRWSPYLICNKFEVTKKAPSRAGIFVIFYLNQSKKLQPFYIGYSWISSIMFDIKSLLYEDANRDREIAEIIDNKKCYYKYVIIDKYNDLVDMYEVLKTYYNKKNVKYIKKIDDFNSGRYNEVFITDYSELVKRR